MDISKAFNACKREDYPFVTQVAAVVATGAFRDFGQCRGQLEEPPRLRARDPRVKRRKFTGTGSSAPVIKSLTKLDEDRSLVPATRAKICPLKPWSAAGG